MNNVLFSFCAHVYVSEREGREDRNGKGGVGKTERQRQEERKKNAKEKG